MERVSIKWDSFEDNVTRSYSQLRNEKKFSDVTLVSDDHHTVSAHKVVLSTCSKYFNEILIEDLTGNVLVCLEGVDMNDLNSLLDYIYQGELTLQQEHIDRFLLMAKRFKLDGFHEDADQLDRSMNQLVWEISSPKCEFPKIADPLSKQVEEADEFFKEASDPLSKQVEEEDEISNEADPLSKEVEEAEEFAMEADPLSKQVEEADESAIKADPLSKRVNECAIKEDPLSKQGEEADEEIENGYLNSESAYTSLGHITISRPGLVPSTNTSGIKLQGFEDVKEKMKDMYIKHPFEFECKVCSKICSKRSNIKEHIEIHIEGLRFPCRTCGSEYGSRSGRRVHERVFHKMKPNIKKSF